MRSSQGGEATSRKAGPVRVQIAGHEYRIRSDGDPEVLREIAGYVDRAMQRVRDRTGTVDTLDVAVLTCLNLGREILGLREQRAPAGAVALEEDRLRALIERVEAAVTSQAAATGGERDRGGSADSEDDATRTLELPSVDAMRERSTAPRERTGDGSALPPRVAAGGRDRAS